MNWRIVSASVVGSAHQSRNELCQDYHIAVNWQSEDGLHFLIALVADGAGSAQFARQGAELACQHGRQLCEEWLTHHYGIMPGQNDLEKLIIELRNRLSSHAEKNETPLREFACTLLIALVTPQAFLFAQIGDGGIVASRAGALELIFWPDNGEYANETHFLTDADALNHLQYSAGESFYSEVALFSDGLQRLALIYETRCVYAPFFTPMLVIMRQTPPESYAILSDQLAAFLASPRINDRTDDDKTLVLASYAEISAH